MTHLDVIKNIKNGQYGPIYLLHGEEPFYIDQIVNYIANNVLDESERDFNQSILYAKDTQPIQVVDAASRLPMMAERQVVIVKEAQEYKKASQWEIFENYFAAPSPQTILVFAHKYKKFDKRSKMYKLLAKNALVFESSGVKDYELPKWVRAYVLGKKKQITDKGVALICEFVGNDLSRLSNELEKLFLLVDDGAQITEQDIEKNIGISKDYNVFELVNAVLDRDFPKALKIIDYFQKNPKAAHITVVISNLLTLYQRLFKVHFLKTNDPRHIASALKIHPYPAKELLSKKAKHPPKIISRNFNILREYDLTAKGVGSSGTPDAELMKELVYKLLH
jgi:DNA polymerase-3 subunit delta